MNTFEGFITENIEGKDEVFFFGTLTFSLIVKESGTEIDEIKAKIGDLRQNPMRALDFVIDFMWAAYRANKLIKGEKTEIPKERLWLWFDVMGPDKFVEIFNKGIAANSETQEKNPVSPQQVS